MIDYHPLFTLLRENGLVRWADELPARINQKLSPSRNRELPGWQALLEGLPPVPAEKVDLNASAVGVQSQNMSAAQRAVIEKELKKLHPWRKGPYNIHGIYIDTEWRSDWKWERLKDHITPLKDRLVLDVGCGNGYHGWRMLGQDARLVIGVDPFLKNVIQFWAVRHFLGHWPFWVLPLGVEDLPAGEGLFDTVFSMGLLYHRRSPLDHLAHLKTLLKRGGELVLEMLVLPEEDERVLVPEDRYAKMRNVWFIPSIPVLQRWLKRIGFREIRLVNVTPTTTDEQRRTAWMTFESLADFLDPADPSKTIEGYPAPTRAILLAAKP